MHRRFFFIERILFATTFPTSFFVWFSEGRHAEGVEHYAGGRYEQRYFSRPRCCRWKTSLGICRSEKEIDWQDSAIIDCASGLPLSSHIESVLPLLTTRAFETAFDGTRLEGSSYVCVWSRLSFVCWLRHSHNDQRKRIHAVWLHIGYTSRPSTICIYWLLEWAAIIYSVLIDCHPCLSALHQKLLSYAIPTPTACSLYPKLADIESVVKQMQSDDAVIICVFRYRLSQGADEGIQVIRRAFNNESLICQFIWTNRLLH